MTLMRWLGVAALMTGLTAGRANGAFLDTINFAPDSVADGLGRGTLANGSILVTYTTAATGANFGTTMADDFTASLATAGAAGMGISNKVAGTFGTLGGNTPTTQTITFSAAVLNPILLVNFTDATSTYNFDSLPLTLLSSNGAQLAGGILTFAGSDGGFNSGFALQINGTFGPTRALTFTVANPTIDPDGFTIGLAVPEPSSLALCGIASLAGLGYAARRHRGR